MVIFGGPWIRKFLWQALNLKKERFFGRLLENMCSQIYADLCDVLWHWWVIQPISCGASNERILFALMVNLDCLCLLTLRVTYHPYCLTLVWITGYLTILISSIRGNHILLTGWQNIQDETAKQTYSRLLLNARAKTYILSMTLPWIRININLVHVLACTW